MKVEGLEIDCPFDCAILFGTDNHVVAPCYWFSNWDRFNDPSLTSLSRPALMASCQCRVTGMGEWCAVGVASGLIISLIGGLSIRGSA